MANTDHLFMVSNHPNLLKSHLQVMALLITLIPPLIHLTNLLNLSLWFIFLLF